MNYEIYEHRNGTAVIVSHNKELSIALNKLLDYYDTKEFQEGDSPVFKVGDTQMDSVVSILSLFPNTKVL